MPFPRLLAISDRRSFPGGDLDPWLRAIAEGPIDAVQIREKDLTDRDLFDLVVHARGVLPDRVALLVNRRVDVALAAGADGVHLTSDPMPPGELRRRFGRDMLIGVSTHHVEEVERAHEAGADYVTFGPVWETPSKTAYGPPQGLTVLARATAVGIPVLALGGVTISRAPEAAAAGAAGIAAIRLFAQPGDSRLTPLAEVFTRPETITR